MLTKVELLSAIEELLDGKHTVQNCERLAAVYTVLDHLYPEDTDVFRGYSNDSGPEPQPIIGNYGNSDFLNAIAGKNAESVWLIVDELMDAVSVLNPNLYRSVLRRINE